MRKKPTSGVRIPCPICNDLCRVKEQKVSESPEADALVQCPNIECGYTARVGVLYHKKGSEPVRFDRRAGGPLAGKTTKRLTLFCPHCLGKAWTRTSSSPHPFLRLLYIYCKDCLYKGKAYLQHQELISMPSGYWVTEIPLSDQLVDGYQTEMGINLEERRKKRDEHT